MGLEDIGIGHVGVGYAAYLGWNSKGGDTTGWYSLFTIICAVVGFFTGSMLVLYIFVFGITIVPLFMWTVNLFFKEDIIGGIFIFSIMLVVGGFEVVYAMRALLNT